MRCVLITFITPASENIRGTSALPYHLLVNRDDKVLFTIYSFNANNLDDKKIEEVEKELNVKIIKLNLPKWYVWMFKLHLLFLRVFLKYPFVNYILLPGNIVNDIKAQNPDLIWVMGEELSRIVKQFPGSKRIQVGPDTESLYYYRMLEQRFVMKDALNYWKCALMYRKYARMEQEFFTGRDFTYYAVGKEDVRHLQTLNPTVQASFLRHPHFDINKKKKKNQFSKPKIKVLIAGQYNHYMKQDADMLSEVLRKNGEDLKDLYSITYLGKGWEKHVGELVKKGYDVNHIKFAENYIKEIIKHDIQITPISIGTGTKGKVLDALANGLLVIGTPFALENIAVEDGDSCIVYRHPKEVVDILLDISVHTGKYEEMAMRGQQKVLEYHNRAFISSQLFND